MCRNVRNACLSLGRDNVPEVEHLQLLAASMLIRIPASLTQLQIFTKRSGATSRLSFPRCACCRWRCPIAFQPFRLQRIAFSHFRPRLRLSGRGKHFDCLPNCHRILDHRIERIQSSLHHPVLPKSGVSNRFFDLSSHRLSIAYGNPPTWFSSRMLPLRYLSFYRANQAFATFRSTRDGAQDTGVEFLES